MAMAVLNIFGNSKPGAREFRLVLKLAVKKNQVTHLRVTVSNFNDAITIL